MEQHSNHTEPLKLDAKKDLIARLDRAVELASDLHRQASVMSEILEEHHAETFAM